jgi:hypothetical protein
MAMLLDFTSGEQGKSVTIKRHFTEDRKDREARRLSSKSILALFAALG